MTRGPSHKEHQRKCAQPQGASALIRQELHTTSANAAVIQALLNELMRDVPPRSCEIQLVFTGSGRLKRGPALYLYTLAAR